MKTKHTEERKEKIEIISEISLEQRDRMIIKYMGGSLVAVDKETGRHLAVEDAPFPGTEEQCRPIKERLYETALSKLS